MNEGSKSRKKPLNPNKTCNFVGRVIGIKVFVGNFTYGCDFIVLEDVSSVIDHYLGRMILGKPFVKESKLIYDKEEGNVMFEKNDERVTFKMPHKMKRFKDVEDLNTDNIPPFFVTRPEYKRDEGVIKMIKFLNRRVIFQEIINRSWRRHQKSPLTPSGFHRDDVTTMCDGVTVSYKEKPLEDSKG
ncbi:protein kinase-like domain, concanavalin A-like lectin/glucanase domain protein [Tanacetum coccineum]